ncbi:MAG: VCBS repeat-containing protein [Acidobacteria bacterium]|nr:VCBS repeat-containing protein [Acidobacteriota bacterium]
MMILSMVLMTVAAYGQTCPLLVFARSSDFVAATQSPRQGAGLQRNSDGSFTKRTYTATNASNVTQQAAVANAQDPFFACTGLPSRPARQALPGGWKVGGDALLGRGSDRAAGGDFLNNGSAMGYCTSFCGSSAFNGTKLLSGLLDSNFNLSSQAQTALSGFVAVGLLAVDVNGDGRRDAVLVGNSVVSVFLLGANGVLGAPSNFTVPSSARKIAAYDVNGDGKMDLVAVTSVGYSVLLGNGNGTFQAAVNATVASGIVSVATGDVNGDGKGDLVAGWSDVVAVGLGNGNGTFQALQTLAVPGDQSYVALGDLNKDGKLDAVVADEGASTVGVLYGDGAGRMTAGPRYAMAEHSVSLFVMDFDLDGNADIVAASGHPDELAPNMDNGRMSVLFGKGDGTFHGTRAYPAGKGGTGTVWADFNGDGRLDAARAPQFSDTISLFLGQGGAEFGGNSVKVTGAVELGALGAADFNGDGKVDLVAAESGSTVMYMLLGKGDGTFQAPTTFTGVADAFLMAAGDLNQDGKQDLAYSNADGKVYVQLGNGVGGFAAATGYASGAFPAGVQIVDVNGDARLDLVVLNRGQNGVTAASVAVLTGKGDGTFNAAVTYPGGVLATAASVGDFNGDGRVDFAVSSALTVGVTYQVLLYLNQGNGTFAAQAPLATSFAPQEIAVADYTQDGKVDLLIGHCCGSSNLTLAVGNGNGTFQAEIVLMTGLGHKGLRAVDLNGDGKADAVGLQGTFPQSVIAIVNLSGASPALSSPAPGSTLSGTSATFQWAAVPNATKYRLDVGSAAGGTDLFSQETTGTSLTVNGLPQDGRTLYVQVLAFVNGAYGSPAAATYKASTVATPLRFVPLPPCRVMETRALYNFEGRTGAFGPPSLQAAETRTMNLPVSTVCAIPATAKAYVVNVTVIPSSTVNFVTVWPAGEPRPNVWTIRSPDGQIVANSAIVKAGANGGISVYSSDATDLLIDISGYYTDSTAVPALTYYPLTPCRVIDTRVLYRPQVGPFGPPSMGARETRKFTFPAAGQYCNVPVAAAYSVTITAVPPGPLAYLTAWPDGSAQPNVSSINSFVGRVLANSVIIPASANGTINVFAYDATDFLVDINGYYAADDGVNGQYYFPVTQCRASDSTVNGGQYADETTRTIAIPTATGCSGIPPTAKGYAINVTALPGGNPMPFLTAYPTGQPQPNASILNAFQGQVVTNSAIVPAGTNGAINIYAYRRTDVVVEVSGYFGR